MAEQQFRIRSMDQPVPFDFSGPARIRYFLGRDGRPRIGVTPLHWNGEKWVACGKCRVRILTER